jgi:hypothetical protein
MIPEPSSLPSSVPPGSPRPHWRALATRWQSWLALALFGFALWVRLTGIEFDPGYVLHADEWIPVDLAQRLAADSAAPVRMWNYPPALANLLSLLYAWLPDAVPTLADKYLGARIVVLCMGVAMCVLCSLAALRIAGCPAALLTLAVAAVSPLWVEQNRYAAVDIPTAFGVAATGLACTFLCSRGETRARWSGYLAAGFCVGLAAAPKYVGAAAGLLVLAVHLASPQRKDPRAWGLLLVAGVLSAVVFVACNYQVISSYELMVSWLQKEYAHYASVGHPGYSSASVWKYALPYFVRYGLGWGASFAALVGVAFSLLDAQGRRVLLPWSVVALAWLAFVVTRRTFFARNMLHCLPLFVVIAGVGFDRVRRRSGQLGRGIPFAVIVGLLLLWPAWQSASFARELELPDTRIVAAEWMRDNLPPGTRVALTPEGIMSYMPPAKIHRLPARQVPGNLPVSRLKKSYDVVVVSFGAINRYLRTPSEEPAKVRAFARWYAELSRSATKLASFERPVGPGGELFGSTVDCYHHPKVEIFRLR